MNGEHIQKLFFRSLSLLLLGGPCTHVYYEVDFVFSVDF